MNDTIFTPQYNITARTQAQLDNIERNAWLVANMLIMPKHEVWFRREVAIRRASATTRIEGAQLNEDAVGDLVRKRPAASKITDDERANLNAIAAYAFIDYLSDLDELNVDEQVISQINREFKKGDAELDTPGVYRKGENKVGDNYTPPNQGDVGPYMRSFALWLREDESTHPVVKAAVAHLHFVAIHPFWDGNGRTARALATLNLQRSPYAFKKLLPLEAHFLSRRDAYMTAIERTLGPAFSVTYDATPWIEFFVDAVDSDGQELVRRLTDWHREADRIHKQAANEGLNDRQTDALLFATRLGNLTRADYMEITGASPITASRDLADLVNKGILLPTGKTRARSYRFADIEY